MGRSRSPKTVRKMVRTRKTTLCRKKDAKNAQILAGKVPALLFLYVLSVNLILRNAMIVKGLFYVQEGVVAKVHLPHLFSEPPFKSYLVSF
jgi:hypothetical protein